MKKTNVGHMNRYVENEYEKQKGDKISNYVHIIVTRLDFNV